MLNLYSCINVFMHEKDMGLTKICIQLDTNPRIDLKGAYERPEKYVEKNKTRKVKKIYKLLFIKISINEDRSKKYYYTAFLSNTTSFNTFFNILSSCFCASSSLYAPNELKDIFIYCWFSGVSNI